MNIRELARSISSETGYNQSDCESFIRAMGYVFEKEIVQGGGCRLPGIGTFKVNLPKVNNYDFKSKKVEERTQIRIQYKPTQAIKEMVKSAAKEIDGA